MEFRILGTVAVATETGELPLGPAKRSGLLATLLLRPNSVVRVEQLIAALWEDEPPLHAKAVLQSHVSRLRALLTAHDAEMYGVRLTTQGSAYALQLPETLLDAHRFEELVALARLQHRPADTVQMLREALSLWQGPALTGTVRSAPLEAAALALEELRIASVEGLSEAYGQLGEHARAAAVLRPESVAHPLRESLAAALVLALGRSGRQSDALDHYHRTRRLLADELGVDPGPVLAAAYRTILGTPSVQAPPQAAFASQPRTQAQPKPSAGPMDTVPPSRPVSDEPAADGTGPDPSPSLSLSSALSPSLSSALEAASPPDAGTGTQSAPDSGSDRKPRTDTASGPAVDPYPEHPAAPTPVHTPAEPPAPPPNLLPRLPRGFSGREAELGALDQVLAGDDAPVCLLAGPAGVGKTALAVHWAHRRHARHDRFPDGVLFADLRGFSDTPAPETPTVLREFLLALGVPARRIPETTAAMGALYRSLAAHRRILVVLDNARTSAQVRPLLPGGDHCATLITSRDRLGGLIASDAATPVPLHPLPPGDAAGLLAAVLGDERVTAEPAAVERLAVLCDGLPLALRVTAARLAERPDGTLAAMAGELADEQRRLSLLDIEDTGVSAALRLTVRHLPAPAAELFGLIGLHTGSDLDRFTAAALTGTTPDEADTALGRLAAAHLVAESAGGRRTPHDLVRLYARTLTPEPAAEPLGRLLDHYLRTALAAAAAAHPESRPCCDLPADIRPAVAVREFPDRAAALDWFEAERSGLEGAVAAAAGAELHDRAWRIALLLWPVILLRVGDGWAPLLEQCLASAEHEDDPDAQSRARALLGWILHEEGRDDEALVHLEQAPGLAARAGDVTSEAIACVNLAVALNGTGEHDRAGLLLSRAVTLAVQAQHPPTEALALHHLARHCLDTGAHEAALSHAVRALDMTSSDEAARRVLLQTACGEALAALGRPDDAADLLGQALRTAESAGFEDGVVAARKALDGLPADR
ncbi:BTAD domain-containing putative transcriptional regulator [Streptomyces sp. NPDC005349]|uniref:AfsR/SARP family transcriptional regulator n=1 Tax=Streptomyces sp. NPDC005349 TaxID=3157037 RepID=UPI0033A7FA43